MARPFDGSPQLTLVSGAHAAKSTRRNPTSLRDEEAQGLDVLVVYVIDFPSTELTKSTSGHDLPLEILAN